MAVEFLSLLSLPVLIVSFILGLITAFYVYATWNYGYWEKQGVKCSKPRIFFGTISFTLTKPLEVQDLEQYQKHGRIFGAYEGMLPSLFVADPEILRTIMVKDFHVFRNRRTIGVPTKPEAMQKMMSALHDDEWKNVRNTITPTFTTGKMKQMIYLIEDCAKQLIKHLNKYEEKKEPFESRRWISSFTMDVIATCAFGTKIDSITNPESEFVKNARLVFGPPSPFLFLIFLFPALSKYLPGFVSYKPLKYFVELMEDVIKARKLEKLPRKDFLNLLLEAKAESEKSATDKNSSAKMAFTDDHIMAQAILFLFAGFETSSITVSFVLYHLALQEDIQEKLISEIDEVLRKHNKIMDYNVLAEMKYMDMVLAETLRMYPPAVRTDRLCEEDGYEINGIKLKKGMNVNIPIYAIHHDEEFYPNPSRFDPERFSAENQNTRNPYTYLPFGYGPRNCIGMRFALMEMKILLIYLFKTFRIRTCSQTQIPFKRKEKSFFLQAESVKLLLEKRTDNKY